MAKKRAKKNSVKHSKRKNPDINIKVVGIGGGGTNAVSRISRNFVRGVDFIAINTDHQDLDHCAVRQKIYIGRNLTRGLGTGMNPELGRQAAEENRSDIAEALEDADLIFLAAGLGGGTGTGAAPVVAEIAKQTGALTLGFVTRPFAFEGSQRERIAQEGLVRLRDKVDALIVIPNDRIFSVISKDTPLLKAFEAIDDVLKNSLNGIVELIVSPGIINLDFADLRTVMENAGTAIVGLGVAGGQNRANEGVQKALNSPLLETSAEGAKGVLLVISGGKDLKMNEINEIARLVAQTADPGARIIFGAYRDKNLAAKQLKITLIATGFNGLATAASLFKSKQDIFDFGKKMETADLPAQAGKSPLTEKSSIEEHKLAGRENIKSLKTEEAEAKKKSARNLEDKESDIWDIPTFLRRRKR